MSDEILDTNLSNDGLKITPEIRSFLQETAKWGKFLAIVGFVMMVLFVIIGLVMGLFMGSMMAEVGDVNGLGSAMGGAVGFVYVAMGLIYFFPCRYLYRFSTKMKTALAQDDQQHLFDSFQNLKSLYKFFGIFMAVMLGIYALGIVLALLGGLFAAM